MSSMKDTSLFKNRYFWIIVIAFVLELLFFFVSPYLFESLTNIIVRLFITVTSYIVLLLSITVYFLFIRDEVQKRLADKREQKKRYKEYSSTIKGKVDDLKVRFAEAMRIISNASIYKSSKRTGYELPWYLMVGKNEEGKTSFLESSGLDFPLNINYEKNSEEEAIAGQSFQWYFAEDAIFIDMPGYYIEQKNKEDSAVWEALLNLFAKKRWQRPINGIILNVSVETLLTQNSEELDHYAKNLRDRFDEISKAFMSNMPIYLFITKSDLIPGFQEYFSTLSESDKEQILGVTFDEKSENIGQEVIRPEIEALLKRLNSSIMDKIHQEWDSDARTKILLFPDEFSGALEKLNHFVERTFSQTRYRQPLMLRGIYFTTVLQGSSSPVAVQNMPEQQTKKGMFIKKALTNVVFPEADIIKMDTNYRKTQRIKQSVAFGIAAFLVFFVTVYWVQDYNARLDRIDLVEKTTLEYEHLRDNISTETDFEQVLSTLNTIESLQHGQEDNISGNIWQIAYYKPDDRNAKIDILYEDALKQILLPRIANFVAEQIRGNIHNYDLTWESTKAYSMLNNIERREKPFLQAWMAAGWSYLYPNKLNVQNDLNAHWNNLLAIGFEAYPIDDETIKIAREKLLGLGHEALVYKQLKDNADKQNIPDFRFSLALGSDATAFRGSDFMIPGFYTKKGYEKVIVGQGRQLIKDLVSNNWVVGYSTELSEADLNEMYAKVQNYYFIDYKDYWSKALASLKIPQYKTISDINYQLTSLTSGNSPIVGVLSSLKENTMLYTPAEQLQMQVDKSENPVGNAAASIASENVMKEESDNTSVKNIRNYFSTYTLLLDDHNKPQPRLKTAMEKLNSVYQEMTAIYGSVTPERDAFEIVSSRIAGKHGPIVMRGVKLPIPVSKWFDRALKNDWEYLLSRTQKYINERYKKEVLEYYLERIEGRYPLVSKSKKYDIRKDDFEEFFKKDGILDSFFDSYVSPFVKLNTKEHTYQFRRIDGSTMYLSKSFMNQLLVAHDIRKALFSSNEEYLTTLLYLQPKMLGRRLSTMEFHYDDHYIVYEHGLVRSQKLNWPAEGQNDIAKFSMYDLDNNKVVELSANGQWGFFKLLEKFNISNHRQRHGTDSVDIKYQKERYEASYTVTGGAAKVFTKNNPLVRFKLKEEI